MIEAYPLCWPEGWKRSSLKRHSPFKATFGKAREELLKELKRLDAKNEIISTNVALRRDGLPYAQRPEIKDCGVAVYFEIKKGTRMCLACDSYLTVEANMKAIAKTIEAMRGIERWGASDMLERAFKGFVALPSSKKPWWEVLGVREDAIKEEIDAAFKKLRSIQHPDKGGNQELFIQIMQAYEEALEKK